eukprot:1289143-Pyramimonas_sp.AAC.1
MYRPRNGGLSRILLCRRADAHARALSCYGMPLEVAWQVVDVPGQLVDEQDVYGACLVVGERGPWR